MDEQPTTMTVLDTEPVPEPAREAKRTRRARVLDAGPDREGEGSGPTWDAEPVPHAEPLAAGPLAAGPLDAGPLDAGPLDAEPLDAEPLSTGPLEAGPLDAASLNPEAVSDDELNRQISEVLTELIRHAHDIGQSIATEFGLTGSDAMALFKLEAPMTMKELGLKMGCDPSFITSIADALEKHGLARREPSLRDRRSKNIVLTPEGVTVRDRICSELSARAPWCTTLDASERRCLLGLMRKMLRSRGRR
jgi:DNA-binding MarR family transcriptional regulator